MITDFFRAIPKPHTFKLKSGVEATLELVVDFNNIDRAAAKTILVESFINEYQPYLQPSDLDPRLTSWREGDTSVQHYYEEYFEEELVCFIEGQLHYWVEVKIEGKVVGWATFEKEPKNKDEAYMNLLIVHPDYQRQGIGTQLVMALITLKEMPDLEGMHILPRIKNKGARKFYEEKLGFSHDPEYKRGNFVDPDLLTGYSWKNPELQHNAVNSESATRK